MSKMRQCAFVALMAGLVLGYAQDAHAANSFKILGGKLVIFGTPKGETKNGEIHVWWDYSWYFRVAGKKVAKGRGRVFDTTVSATGGSFTKEHKLKGLSLKVEGEVEGNEIHIDVTGRFNHKGSSAKLASFELSGKVGG